MHGPSAQNPRGILQRVGACATLQLGKNARHLKQTFRWQLRNHLALVAMPVQEMRYQPVVKRELEEVSIPRNKLLKRFKQVGTAKDHEDKVPRRRAIARIAVGDLRIEDPAKERATGGDLIASRTAPEKPLALQTHLQ